MNDETAAPERSPDRRSGRERRKADRGPRARMKGTMHALRGPTDRRSDSVPVEVDGEENFAGWASGLGIVTTGPLPAWIDPDGFRGAWVFLNTVCGQGRHPNEVANILWQLLDTARTRPPEPGASERRSDESELLALIAKGYSEEAAQKARAMAVRAPTPEHGDDDGE